MMRSRKLPYAGTGDITPVAAQIISHHSHTATSSPRAFSFRQHESNLSSQPHYHDASEGIPFAYTNLDSLAEEKGEDPDGE